MTGADILQPITRLRGIGPGVAAKYARLGIERVQDLLFHLPLRYEDRTRATPISSLRDGMGAVIVAQILRTDIHQGRRRSLLVYVSDGEGMLTLRFFHFGRAQQQGLREGATIHCYGEARQGPTGLELVHPEYKLVAEGDEPRLEDTLTPIYPATEGLGQITLRRHIGSALDWLEEARIEDHVEPSLLPDPRWPGLAEAIRYLHAPPADADLATLASGNHPAQQRLAFDELLAHNLSLRALRAQAEQRRAPPIEVQGALKSRLLANLPFSLTAAQNKVLGELERDMRRAHPMQRLVQGDVGSGKTVVAALCALDAIEAGYQVAVMAPTEILAEQHLRTLGDWLEPLGIETAWLTGRLRSAQRKASLERIGSGQARLAVGTHALFQNDVAFHDLALVIVDEQHRFGVHQRLQLREKGIREGRHPHQLIMTATPIPRTLAMTAYADLDVSVIDELPPNRKPVRTVAMPESRRNDIIGRIREVTASGRQVYWVCPLIEESELLEAQAAEDTAVMLREQLAGINIGLVHGRMKAAEKEAVMAEFKAGKSALLVATTVIEVGVDVPNASLMVIENAERLGLAQLHQLRGRVGRGSASSSCVLLYRPPLSAGAHARLKTMRDTNDGFRIAEADLRLRGPGEVLGTRQTGDMQFRIAELSRDGDLLNSVRAAADRMVRDSPSQAAALSLRWVGDDARYGEV